MEWAGIARRAHLPVSLQARTWTLALLQGTSAVGLLGVAAAPLNGAASTGLYDVCGFALVAATVALLLFGHRIGDRGLLALMGLRIVVSGAAVAGAHGAGAALFGGAGLVWVGLWVTAFFRARVVTVTFIVETLAIAVAVALNADHLRTAADSLPMLTGGVILSLLLSGVLSTLRHEARHDLLTGLLNRRGLDQAVRELSTGRRFAGTASLVAIDLDGLKEINDRAGHLAGDQLLQTFAVQLQMGVRGVDLVARVGGDEFIAILPGMTAGEATLWAAQMRGRSEISWSFGVAERRADEPFEPWLARADQRMYEAKAATRDRRLRSVPALVGVSAAV